MFSLWAPPVCRHLVQKTPLDHPKRSLVEDLSIFCDACLEKEKELSYYFARAAYVLHSSGMVLSCDEVTVEVKDFVATYGLQASTLTASINHADRLPKNQKRVMYMVSKTQPLITKYTLGLPWEMLK
jgi:hypothetical protein